MGGESSVEELDRSGRERVGRLHTDRRLVPRVWRYTGRNEGASVPGGGRRGGRGERGRGQPR